MRSIATQNKKIITKLGQGKIDLRTRYFLNIADNIIMDGCMMFCRYL